VGAVATAAVPAWAASPTSRAGGGRAWEKPAVPVKGGKDATTTWLLIGGGIAGGVVILAGLGVLLSGKKGQQRRGGKVKASETQIDDYKLLNLIVTGQNTQVWEVSEVGSGRPFALKTLLPEQLRSEQQRQILYHEGEVGRQIIHPKIIKTLSVVQDRNCPYLLMEYFSSVNLKLRLLHKEELVKENLHTILEQSALALAFMHERGWVHRDVKPDHILVNNRAEVRLIDFGIAQRLAKGKRGLLGRKVGKAQGTRSYMSPEQIRGESLDARADLYSFGISIYELITSRPPFRASNPQDLLSKHILEKPPSPQLYNPDVTDDLADLVLRMLAKKRDDRPRDFHDFLQKFRMMRLFKSTPARPIRKNVS
jgi:serine/threonine protein kinase